MDEKNVTVTTPEQTGEGQERTFTQEEVDKLVESRLWREREKYKDYEDLKAKADKYDAAEEAQKSELQKATERADALQKQLDSMLSADKLRQIRDKVAQETGVPASLLSGETEEACTEQAKAILSFAQPQKYPSVKDGGEVRPTGSGSTSEQFANWFSENFGK